MDYISIKCKIWIEVNIVEFYFYSIKDCDIRLWHIENCDNIKQVMEQNKLRNAKIVSVSMKNILCFIKKQK